MDVTKGVKRKKLGLSLKATKKSATGKGTTQNNASTITSAFRKGTANSCNAQTAVLADSHAKKPGNIITIDDDDNDKTNYSAGIKTATLKKDSRREAAVYGKDAAFPDKSTTKRESVFLADLFPLCEDWKALDDLPITPFPTCIEDKPFESDTKRSKKSKDSAQMSFGNKSIAESSDMQQESSKIFDGYCDLPKPCMACYTRKPPTLIMPNLEDDKHHVNFELNGTSNTEIPPLSVKPLTARADIKAPNKLQSTCEPESEDYVSMLEDDDNWIEEADNLITDTCNGTTKQHGKDKSAKTGTFSSVLTLQNTGHLSLSSSENFRDVHKTCQPISSHHRENTTASPLSSKSIQNAEPNLKSQAPTLSKSKLFSSSGQNKNLSTHNKTRPGISFSNKASEKSITPMLSSFSNNVKTNPMHWMDERKIQSSTFNQTVTNTSSPSSVKLNKNSSLNKSSNQASRLFSSSLSSQSKSTINDKTKQGSTSVMGHSQATSSVLPLKRSWGFKSSQLNKTTESSKSQQQQLKEPAKNNQKSKISLRSCPICQQKFPALTKSEEIQKHISSCIIDDDDDDWL